MAEIDVLKAQIVRDNVQTPWGFRLQGGTEYGQPITIQRVTPGSPAARIGLRSGDEVTEIGDKKTRFWTHGQASNAITQYGQTMILTVERPAHGAVPQNPVISSQSPSGQPGRGYDMYDLTGASSHPRNPTYQQPQEFHRATARPFEPPSTRPQPPPAAVQPEPHYRSSPQQAYYPQYQHLEPENRQGEVRQSGTFNILASLLSNEEPPAGSSGLPPPRSAYQEQRKQEAAMARQSSPRVKVFMPQQYNTPLGMYSAQNVVETFQSQADRQLDEIESKHPDIVSGAQRAALEEDRYRAATSDL